VRGDDNRTGELFSYVDLEARVRRDHPLRPIRMIVNEALSALEREFAALYSPIGRPSISPEKLLRAMLLQAFYSIRSERLLMERLEYDLLFRWFVGIGVDDAAWDHSVFSKNRDRLLEGDIAAKFLAAVLTQPKVNKLLSSDHFSVDGTLIEAWASMKSVKPKDGSGEPPAQGGGRNAEADFHGQKRSNDTHASTTDPDARLYRKGKGKETKLCFIGHGLMENRHGLLVDACLTLAHACRTGGCAAHDRASCRPAHSDHAWRRQSLRCRRLRQRAALDERDAACCAEHQRPQLCDRRSNDPARRLCRQPAHPQAHRGGIRLDQDDRGAREDQLPRP
jgi:transposase